MREELKAARKRLGYTQQQMADKIGISLRYYQKIESASSNGSIAVWDVLEDILKIHQQKLREISENRRVPKESQ